MERFFKIGIAFTILVALVIGAGLLCGRSDPYIPEDGAWYGEELRLQLSFDKAGDTFQIVDGSKKLCTWEHDRNSKYLSVCCGAEVVFTGRFVKLDAQEYILADENGKEYRFWRCD